MTTKKCSQRCNVVYQEIQLIYSFLSKLGNIVYKMMFYITFYYICFLSTVSLKILVLASNSRPTFVPRRIAATNNVSWKSSSSKLSSPISSLPTSSDFLSEKDAKILESLVAVITLFRGGGNDDYYDDREHQSQNDSYYSSSSSSQGGDYNDGRYGGADDEDRYYDDRGASVRTPMT